MHTFTLRLTLALLAVEAAVLPPRACKQKPLGASSHTVPLFQQRTAASLLTALGASPPVTVPTSLKVSAPAPTTDQASITFTTHSAIGFNESTQAGPSSLSATVQGTVFATSLSASRLATDLPPVSATSTASGLSSPLASKSYSGPESAFPGPSDWVSFDELWSLNADACNAPANDGNGDTIRQDIQQVGQESGMDPRVILATILQESTCQLNAPTTNGGVRNPGLMQSFNGAAYNGTAASILQMIRDGVEGTSQAGGNGIQQYTQKYGLYTGLRAYNSGPNGVDANNLNVLSAGTGTASYCSDIANRLTGAKVA